MVLPSSSVPYKSLKVCKYQRFYNFYERVCNRKPDLLMRYLNLARVDLDNEWSPLEGIGSVATSSCECIGWLPRFFVNFVQTQSFCILCYQEPPLLTNLFSPHQFQGMYPIAKCLPYSNLARVIMLETATQTPIIELLFDVDCATEPAKPEKALQPKSTKRKRECSVL